MRPRFSRGIPPTAEKPYANFWNDSVDVRITPRPVTVSGLKVEELRVQYISQARLGDTLVPKVWHEGNEYIVWLELDGKSCCTSYFRIKEGEVLVPIAPGIDLGTPGTKTKEDM